MFYKYCGISGKIVPSTQLAAYQPQGLTPYSGKATQVVFDSIKTQPVRETEGPFLGSAPARGAASAPPQPVSIPTSDSGSKGVVPATAAYRKIMEMQNLMTRNDGKLVWQKLSHDKAGYVVTVTLTAIGTALCLNLLYKMAFPRKKTE